MNNEDLRNQYAGMAMQALISRHAKGTFFKDALPGIIERSVLAADMLVEKLAEGSKDTVIVGGRYWIESLPEGWKKVTVIRLRGEWAGVKDATGGIMGVRIHSLHSVIPPSTNKND